MRLCSLIVVPECYDHNNWADFYIRACATSASRQVSLQLLLTFGSQPRVPRLLTLFLNVPTGKFPIGKLPGPKQPTSPAFSILTNDLKLFVYSKLQNGREFQKLSPDHMSYKNPAPIKLPTTKSGCRSLPHVTIRDVQSWPQLAGASRISQLRQLR